jgi:hypothetical protein
MKRAHLHSWIGTGLFSALLLAQTSAPELVFLQELEPWPEEFASEAAPSAADLERFQKAWAKVRGKVEPKVTVSKLEEISLENEKGSAVTLTPGWSASIPMNPVGMSRDKKRILFAQDTEESGVHLPPDKGIVHRRLLVGAVFDRSTGTIPKVYVTIRGWAEE